MAQLHRDMILDWLESFEKEKKGSLKWHPKIEKVAGDNSKQSPKLRGLLEVVFPHHHF